MKSSPCRSFWLGPLFSASAGEHEEEWGRSGAPHFQKGFQSLPQAQETCGKGCQWWCPGQGWGQSEGPQFRHIPYMNLREERVKFPSSFQPRVFVGR